MEKDEKEEPRQRPVPPTPHFTCYYESQRSTNSPITLSQCREHDEILVQFNGSILLYQDQSPGSLIITAKTETTETWQWRREGIMSFLVLAILWVLFSNLSADQTLPPTAALNGTQMLRTEYFSFQQENMKVIASSLSYNQYDQSILGWIIQHLIKAANTSRHPPACLCHHHLDPRYSINGTYAPVCIIPLARNHWQPLVNPREMSSTDLHDYNKNEIISRTALMEDSSWVFKPEKKWRYNTYGIHSSWPALSMAFYSHPLQVSWIVHDTTAHCMALSIDEIKQLLLTPR